MSIYETWALILSIIAILIPFVQMAWRRWVIKPKLEHYQTGNGFLYINQSGSYIRIQSVYEAINKPISVKKLSLCVERKRDRQQRNYVWSSFISPSNVMVAGNNAFATETAHPFRIEANNIFCAFTEYGDAEQNAYRILTPKYNALTNKAKEIARESISFDEAKERYCSCDEYLDAKQSLEKENFWFIDKYLATISAEYGKNKKNQFKLSFDVTDEQYQKILGNMKESLIFPLKTIYGIPNGIQTVYVQIQS